MVKIGLLITMNDDQRGLANIRARCFSNHLTLSFRFFSSQTHSSVTGVSFRCRVYRSGQQVGQKHGAPKSSGRDQTDRHHVSANAGKLNPVWHSGPSGKHRRGAGPNSRTGPAETHL